MHNYNDYHKLICKMAWKFHFKTGIDHEEFIAEFNVVFVESDLAYKGDIPFKNYLCGNIVRRFTNLMTRRNLPKNANIIATDNPPPAVCYDLMDSILIRDSFFNSKDPIILQIAEIICTETIPQTSIRDWLRKKLTDLGYKHKQISDAFVLLRKTIDPEVI